MGVLKDIEPKNSIWYDYHITTPLPICYLFLLFAEIILCKKQNVNINNKWIEIVNSSNCSTFRDEGNKLYSWNILFDDFLKFTFQLDMKYMYYGLYEHSFKT